MPECRDGAPDRLGQLVADIRRAARGRRTGPGRSAPSRPGPARTTRRAIAAGVLRQIGGNQLRRRERHRGQRRRLGRSAGRRRCSAAERRFLGVERRHAHPVKLRVRISGRGPRPARASRAPRSWSTSARRRGDLGRPGRRGAGRGEIDPGGRQPRRRLVVARVPAGERLADLLELLRRIEPVRHEHARASGRAARDTAPGPAAPAPRGSPARPPGPAAAPSGWPAPRSSPSVCGPRSSSSAMTASSTLLTFSQS